MSAIIDFLGYDPLSEATGWGERLVLGMTQKAAAKGWAWTRARWERGEREPAGAFLRRVKGFLREPEEPVVESLCAG
jgi:hypothetical protein